MCETNYRMEFRSKDKLTEKAIENFITIVGYASRNLGIEIEVKKEQQAKNDFVAEIKKFTNKNVIVEIHNGETYEGKLKGLHFANGHCVLMTDTEKLFIRGVKLIKRKRNAEE